MLSVYDLSCEFVGIHPFRDVSEFAITEQWGDYLKYAA